MIKQWFRELDARAPFELEHIVTLVSADSPDQKMQVGAIIVAEDGCIIAEGFNHLVPGYPTTGLDWFDSTWKTAAVIHAEHAALIDLTSLSPQQYRLRLPYAMIVTHTPCEQCAKLLAMSEIGRLHILTHQPKRQSSLDFLAEMGFNISIGSCE